MNEIDIFPWIDNFNTGIEKIDEQHMRLVLLLNQLASSLMFHSDIIQLNLVLDELTNYAVYHFQSEEAIWIEFLGEDALLTGHIESHNHFVSKINELKCEESLQTSALLDNVLKYLTDWLVSHILHSDRYMAMVVRSVQSGEPIDIAKKRADEQIVSSTRILIGIILSIYDKLSTNTLELIRENTARRQLNNALIKSKTQLSSLINSTNDLIWSVDSEHFGLLMFNCGLSDYFKQSRGIHITEGMRPEDLFPAGQYVQFWRDCYQRAMHEGSVSIEYEVYAKNRTLLLSFNSLIQDNVIYGISVFGRDITERKNAETALYERDVFLRTITDNIPGMLAYWSNDLRCLFANDGYRNWFGRTAKEMHEISIQDLLGEDLFRLNEPLIRAVLRGENLAFERALVNPNGESGYKLAQYFAHAVKGEVKGFFVLATDLTQIKEAKEKLQEATFSLGYKEGIINQLTDYSNELNTTLKVLARHKQESLQDERVTLSNDLEQLIVPFLAKLKKDTRDPKYMSLINIIETNLHQLISSYGQPSSFSAASKKLTPKEIQIASMIRQGMSSKEIAATMSLSGDTVSNHRKSIRKKLGLESKSINLRSQLTSLQ